MERTRLGSTIFTITAVMLFTVSAIYHRGAWSPRVWAFLQRFDHANIFLLIAGSYTPFTLLMLEGSSRVTLLSIAWGGALLGIGSLVGTGHHGHVRHRRVRREHAGHLRGQHVVATSDVHLALPAGEREAAGVVERAEVARAQPSVDDGVRGGLWVAPVARHGGVAARTGR